MTICVRSLSFGEVRLFLLHSTVHWAVAAALVFPQTRMRLLHSQLDRRSDSGQGLCCIFDALPLFSHFFFVSLRCCALLTLRSGAKAAGQHVKI